jgi:hypothetical protein
MGAMQQSILMYGGVSGGTDLGSETYARSGALARFTFASTGTVVASGVGGSVVTDTSPCTNWNTSGGTHFSYQVIDPNIGIGSINFTGTLAESSQFGENRHALTADMVFSATAATGEDANMTIKVSIWNAASGGSRVAFGTYNLSTANP